MSKSKDTSHADQVKKNAFDKLVKLGNQVYNQINMEKFPEFEMPLRTSTNIYYDEKTRQYSLGKKKIKRTSRNVRHLKPFLQTMFVSMFAARDLLEPGRTSTLRDLYYSSESAMAKMFTDQSESDNIITDVESIIGLAREDFNIFPDARSTIFGDLTVSFKDKKTGQNREINLTFNPDGQTIGPTLVRSDFVKTSADKVICIESGGMFQRLVEEDADEQFNAILIHLAGQAPRGTRRLIRRINEELKLPVYAFVDGDPWGVHIYNVIASGSATAAHLSGLTTPDAIWMGLTPTDITKYDLPTDQFTKGDTTRTVQLLRDPRYQKPYLQNELKQFLKIKKKAEQQSLTSKSLTFVVDEYLPEKFKELSKLQKEGII
ncbi:MAG: DNA topoisomerase IV subunit A [Candidatus Heimdallarchaeota archaeon]|nr:DNA topoisomerase IV subunit A [Candidatus Heimdallarchaeota archaeon]